MPPLATRSGLAQFLRFGLVGVANTLTTWAVVRALAPLAGVSLASVAGYAAGMVQSFIVNRLWTFRDTRSGAGWQREAVRFVAVNLVCAGLFTLTTTLVAPWLGLTLATLAGVALVTPVGFILNRTLVFR